MVTMRDIAAQAGVSQATVSYALHGDSSISEETRQRVLAVANDLNYTVNLSARSLRSGRSHAIGVVLQDLANPFNIHLADAISRNAQTQGLQAVIQQTLYSQDTEQQILQHVVSAFCDGVVMFPSKLTVEQIRAHLSGKPMLLLLTEREAPDVDTIAPACGQALFTATSYLLSTGCRNLIFMGAAYQPYENIKDTDDSTLARVAGFQRALLTNNLTVAPEQFIATPNGWNPASGRAVIHELVKSGKHFDGVVCINDALALGVIRGLNDLGVRIPDDVSVIGYDGISQGEIVTPSLTTVANDFEDSARKITEMLTARIQDYDAPARHLTMTSRLIVRESTR
ncbi:LacI family DNA-binding transcriptional regulator [Bifidobacterium oedipodis]|uniref:Periplasmic binding protein-like domain-containing protein n=1 Tax=Bifidobacterium oedipodis TaxID=2675322 RepID=A0A7Y0EQP5_9BIFI|nr:LacI family DNA-binding transcriptional regulator [Bifidobacterium sp. DSM 109957]NMM94584.1 Periplasmic binding protein-like domain-containing protein [Bifidobacterium sp. DSM 109957]